MDLTNDNVYMQAAIEAMKGGDGELSQAHQYLLQDVEILNRVVVVMACSTTPGFHVPLALHHPPPPTHEPHAQLLHHHLPVPDKDHGILLLPLP